MTPKGGDRIATPEDTDARPRWARGGPNRSPNRERTAIRVGAPTPTKAVTGTRKDRRANAGPLITHSVVLQLMRSVTGAEPGR